MGGGGAAERLGKIYYLDGAGNWGFGTSEVPQGLKQAGFKGDVEIFVWTTSLFPLIDQLNIPAARLRALELSSRIKECRRRNPDVEIHVIALSAGTGVATWAIESLPSDVKIDNFVMLGSSLSHDYDMTDAAKRISGKFLVYYSPHDTVLDAVEVVGTIDGKRGTKSVGQVGLKPRKTYADQVVNVPWSRKWLKLGWAGGHTDCTNERFVRQEIARHLIGRASETATVEREAPPKRPVSAAGH